MVVFSTLKGYHEYIVGYHDSCKEYHEYIRSVQYIGGISENNRGY